MALAKRPAGAEGFLRGLLRGLSIGIVALVATVAILAIVVPRVVDAVPLTVLTGSMRPTLEPGTLVVSQKIDADDVRMGDIVTYQLRSGEPELITHRVKEVVHNAYGVHHFITRGDANGADDAPVLPEQIKGRVLYQLPYLGFAAQAVPSASKPIILQALGGGLLLWSLWELATARRKSAVSKMLPRRRRGAPHT